MSNECFALGAPRVRSVRVGGREILRFYAPRVLGESCAAEHFRVLCEILEQYALCDLAEAAKTEFEAGLVRNAVFLSHFVRVDISFFEKHARLCIELSYSHTNGKETFFLYRLPTFWSKEGALQYRSMGRAAKIARNAARAVGQARGKTEL